ncbi:MAG: [Fe-Fe] hydrogenase large subunit C-terminal domain-containing protein, partial [Thermodesulfobacteriota bacterium]
MQAACFVQTIKERCRVCYTCVRECPAKAIGISDGQAQVIPERCIGCGNCARVCSQGAKQVLDGTHQVALLLRQGKRMAALIAPSFPAEFEECGYDRVVGMVRALGFHYVIEVGFAADLVAGAYRKLLQSDGKSNYIATTCPALVGYVERYYPDLVPRLAPIV